MPSLSLLRANHYGNTLNGFGTSIPHNHFYPQVVCVLEDILCSDFSTLDANPSQKTCNVFLDISKTFDKWHDGLILFLRFNFRNRGPRAVLNRI